MSYNVRYQGADTGECAWANRRDAVAGTLTALSPDIVAFQEVWLDQVADLRDRLAGFGWVAPEQENEHTAVAYRADRYSTLDWGTFWLSEADAEPETPGWDGTYPRRVTHATLRDEQTATEIAVYSVHLDHEGDRARTDGVKLVRDHLTERYPDRPVAVTGDFNCEPGSPAYERAVESTDQYRHLRDTRTVAETVTGPAASYTGFSGAETEGVKAEEDGDCTCIDHVLVTDEITVDRFETHVPEADSPTPRPSDHRPVVVDLVVSTDTNQPGR